MERGELHKGFPKQPDEPEDNLPLDGEVYVKDDVRVYIYRGYHCQDFNQCAVHVKGEGNTKWVERKLLTPVNP